MRTIEIKTLPSKDSKWVDKDEEMLHACFQLLVDCVEEENLLNHCSYEHHKKSVDEAKYLYEWWKQNYKELEPSSDEVQEHLLRLINIRMFLWT